MAIRLQLYQKTGTKLGFKIEGFKNIYSNSIVNYRRNTINPIFRLEDSAFIETPKTTQDQTSGLGNFFLILFF